MATEPLGISDTSPCPMCGKPVGPEAATCPHCGEALTPAVVLSPEERERRRQQRLQKSLMALGLMIAVLAGISAFSPAMAVGAALLLGPASIATMVKATAAYSPGNDPSDQRLMIFFWKCLGWTCLLLVGAPLAIGVMFAVVCGVMGIA